MKKAIINLRVNEDLKSQADQVLKGMGLTMSSAITMFLMQVVRTNSIPLELKAIDNPAPVKKIEPIEKPVVIEEKEPENPNIDGLLSVKDGFEGF